LIKVLAETRRRRGAGEEEEEERRGGRMGSLSANIVFVR